MIQNRLILISVGVVFLIVFVTSLVICLLPRASSGKDEPEPKRHRSARRQGLAVPPMFNMTVSHVPSTATRLYPMERDTLTSMPSPEQGPNTQSPDIGNIPNAQSRNNEFHFVDAYLMLLHDRKRKLENGLDALAYLGPRISLHLNAIDLHRNRIASATSVVKELMDNQNDLNVPFSPADIHHVQAFCQRPLFGQIFYAMRNVAYKVKQCAVQESHVRECFGNVEEDVEQFDKYMQVIMGNAACSKYGRETTESMY